MLKLLLVILLTGSVASASVCAEDIQSLGWNDLKESANVELYAGGNFDPKSLGWPEEMYYDYFSAMFKLPANKETSKKYFRNIGPDYTLKFTDEITGSSFDVASSDLVKSQGEPGRYGVAVSYDQNDPKVRYNHNHLVIQISRGIYDKIKTFGKTKVDLMCDGKVIVSGSQDVQAMVPAMSTPMVKTVRIGRDSWGYAQPKDAFLHYMSDECPVWINAGEAKKCTGAGLNVKEVTWVVDGKVMSKGQEFDLKAMAKGQYMIQAYAVFTNGMIERGQSWLVKVK